MLNQLTQLGLSPNEAKLYKALQLNGKAKAGQLIKETGLHRNLVYTALAALESKHLITKSTSGKVAIFSPNDPSHLLDHLKEQELIAEELIDQLKHERSVADHEITIYEGAEGMRAFSFQNAKQLKDSEYIYVLGSGGEKFETAMGPRALKKYFRLIDEHGGAKVLMYRSQQYSPSLFANVQPKSNIELKTLPIELNPSAGVIFTNRSVAFHIYEEPISVIEIKNKRLVDAYKNYFNLLWNQPTQTLSGPQGIIDLCELVLNEQEDLYLIAATGSILTTHPEYYQSFTQRRVKHNIQLHMLANESIRKTDFTNLPASTVKFLPSAFESPMVVWIFGNYVANVFWNEPQHIFLIHDQQAANAYRKHFEGFSRLASN